MDIANYSVFQPLYIDIAIIEIEDKETYGGKIYNPILHYILEEGEGEEESKCLTMITKIFELSPEACLDILMETITGFADDIGRYVEVWDEDYSNKLDVIDLDDYMSGDMFEEFEQVYMKS